MTFSWKIYWVFTFTLQEEYSEIYSSICELRERSTELQKCIEDAEQEGDLRKADSFRDELQSIEEMLLEKNEERKAKYVHFLDWYIHSMFWSFCVQNVSLNCATFNPVMIRK